MTFSCILTQLSISQLKDFFVSINHVVKTGSQVNNLIVYETMFMAYCSITLHVGWPLGGGIHKVNTALHGFYLWLMDLEELCAWFSPGKPIKKNNSLNTNTADAQSKSNRFESDSLTFQGE